MSSRPPAAAIKTEPGADPSTGFAPYFHSRCWRAGRHGRLAAGQQAAADLQPLHRLRFDVYCSECGYLDAADHPDGCEHDAHDADAAHFGACNLRGELVGMSRLVFSQEGGVPYPLEAHGAALHAGVALLRGGQAAEVSRLMVRHDYRRRRGDTLAGVTDERSAGPLPQERRQGSAQIVLSLYRQMFQYSRRAGIHTWYAAMESFLPQSLERFGFSFECIGPERDYYGPVAPYRQDLQALERTLPLHNPALMQWLLQPDDPPERAP